MKARYEFPSDEKYYEYLHHYYAGLALQAMMGNLELLAAVNRVFEKDERAEAIGKAASETALSLVKAL